MPHTFHKNLKPTFPWIVVSFVMVMLVSSSVRAGLIINEVFRGNHNEERYVEFLLTSDLTLQELDGIWFGDSGANTRSVSTERNFNSAEIISNSSYFNSTSDTLRAGTFLTVAGSRVATDFTYNPSSSNPGDTDSWNITLGNGAGFGSGGGGPSLFNIQQNGDVIWVSSSRPSAGAGSSDFISALAFDRQPGALALEVQALAQSGNDAFQLVTRPEFDDRLGRGNSLSNLSDDAIDFANSEASGGSLGIGNPGSSANNDFAYDLRAVPEPSTVIPCLVIAAFGIVVAFRANRREATTAV